MFSTRKCLLVILSLIMVASAAIAWGCTEEAAGDDEQDPMERRGELHAGSGAFSEPWILAEIAKVLLEDAGFEVEHTRNFQGSTVLHQALEAGDLDFYVSWTGTQFAGILEKEVTDEWLDREKVYDYVKQEFAERYNQTWSPPLGFNNTYALAVRRDFAEEHDIQTQSELRDISPELTIAMDTTFMDRVGDGYPDMLEHYDMEFAEAHPMDYGIIYRAVAQGDVDVAVAYTTDGRVAGLDLVILEDDREFFPPYDGAVVLCTEMLEKSPAVEEILSIMWGAFDEHTMSLLNAKVDVEEEEYEDVAREFVQEMGWID